MLTPEEERFVNLRLALKRAQWAKTKEENEALLVEAKKLFDAMPLEDQGSFLEWLEKKDKWQGIKDRWCASVQMNMNREFSQSPMIALVRECVMTELARKRLAQEKGTAVTEKESWAKVVEEAWIKVFTAGDGPEWENAVSIVKRGISTLEEKAGVILRGNHI